MPTARTRNAEKFDAYAQNYEQLHAQSIAASGESTEYFAAYKVDCLMRKGVKREDPILDFGCGIGNVTEQLVKSFSHVHGYEPSPASLEILRERVPSSIVYSEPEAVPNEHFAAAILSGVLHHVTPAERPGVLAQVMEKLRPGGRVFIFEHNPLNPATRHAVATCPFDDDAILLWPWEAKRLLRQVGFESITLDYIVFFPRILAFLRALEPRLSWLALGAQTLVLGTKPV